MVLVGFSGGPLDTRTIGDEHSARKGKIYVADNDKGHYAYDKVSHCYVWFNQVETVHIRPATQHTTTT